MTGISQPSGRRAGRTMRLMIEANRAVERAREQGRAEGRAEAFADARDALSRATQVWHIDGTDPCRVRVLSDVVQTLSHWADGSGTPEDPARAWRGEPHGRAWRQAQEGARP